MSVTSALSCVLAALGTANPTKILHILYLMLVNCHFLAHPQSSRWRQQPNFPPPADAHFFGSPTGGTLTHDRRLHSWHTKLPIQSRRFKASSKSALCVAPFAENGAQLRLSNHEGAKLFHLRANTEYIYFEDPRESPAKKLMRLDTRGNLTIKGTITEDPDL